MPVMGVCMKNVCFLLRILSISACMMPLFLLLSCADAKYVRDSVAVNPYDKMCVSDFVKDCTEIRLQQSDSCVISQIDAVKISGGSLLVSDRNQLYLFDTNGQFKKRIGQKGNGHGEYIRIDDFDMVGDNVFVLSSYQNVLLEYTAEGNFVRKHSLCDTYFKFSPVDDRVIILDSQCSNDTHANFVWYDVSSDKEVRAVGSFDKNQSMVMDGFTAFIGTNGHQFVALPFDYSVYMLHENGGELESLVTFEFETKEKFPSDASTKDFNELYESTKNRNVVKYLQGYVEKEKRRYLMYPLFDEQGGINTCITCVKTDGSSLTYKLGSVIDKSYRYFDMGDFMGVKGDSLILTCPADVILRCEKERGLSHFAKTGLKSGDNPVVFVYTLK